MLTEMHKASSKDFNTMRIIYDMSKKINYVDHVSSQTRYLRFDIKHHFIWQNLSFWEQLFITTASKQFSRELVDGNEKEQSAREVLFLYRSLKRFGYMMLDWGLPLEIVGYFVSMTSSQIKLPERKALTIETKLEKYQSSLLKIEQRTKEKEEKKNMIKKEREEKLSKDQSE